MWGEGDLVLQVGLDWGLLMGLIVCVCVCLPRTYITLFIL